MSKQIPIEGMDADCRFKGEDFDTNELRHDGIANKKSG